VIEFANRIDILLKEILPENSFIVIGFAIPDPEKQNEAQCAVAYNCCHCEAEAIVSAIVQRINSDRVAGKCRNSCDGLNTSKN
jgi:hypothetical protein